jgi:hypothetical protein
MGDDTWRVGDIPDEERYCDYCGGDIGVRENFTHAQGWELFNEVEGLVKRPIFHMFHEECWEKTLRS